MNKVIATTGLVALGVSSLQAANDTGLSSKETAKPWSVSAAVRGFYDSNTTTSPDYIPDSAKSSWGAALDIGLGYNLPLDQTFLGLDYNYGLKWYDNRATNEFDQSHRFNLNLNHAFNESWNVDVVDNFSYSSEPTVTDAGGVITNPLRTDNNNIRNRGALDVNGQLSNTIGIRVGYENVFYNYEQEAGDVINPVLNPSRSQLLDRMEHYVPFDFRYQFAPQTVGIVGYKFGLWDYSSTSAYGVQDPNLGGILVNPNWRDVTLHTGLIGVEHNFNSQLNGFLKGGVQYLDYSSLPQGSGYKDARTTPYIDLGLSYLYNPGSYLQFGYKHVNNPSDLRVLSAESDVVYLTLNHRISAKLNMNILAQYQHSRMEDYYNGSSFLTLPEDFWVAGINFTYAINNWLSTEIGYNYDNLNSAVQVAGIDTRSYDRHVGYVGFRGSW